MNCLTLSLVESMLLRAERLDIHIYTNSVWVLSQGPLYTPGLGEQSGVLKDSMMKVYLVYQNTDEILKLLKKIMN